jgi:hypothetical protein
MKATILAVLAGMTALTCPGLVLGDEPIPDLRGDWVGTTYTIIAGHGGHWPTSVGTFEKPGLYQKDLVIRVTQQADRRFWGVTIISGSGQKTQEPFIGELTGKDHRYAVFVDTDGISAGRSAETCFRFATRRRAPSTMATRRAS